MGYKIKNPPEILFCADCGEPLRPGGYHFNTLTKEVVCEDCGYADDANNPEKA